MNKKSAKPKTGDEHHADTAPKKESAPLPEAAAELAASVTELEATAEPEAVAADPLADYDRAALSDMYLRAEAEKNNIRRRAEEQVMQTRKFALEGFARGICDVCDCLEAALLADGDGQKMHEGVTLTLRKLAAVMEANGIRSVRPDAGASFDPALHQAIGVDSSGQQPANTVVAVAQCGYTINGRVVRAARVMVSKPADSGNSNT